MTSIQPKAFRTVTKASAKAAFHQYFDPLYRFGAWLLRTLEARWKQKDWQRLKQLYEQASGMQPQDRANFVERVRRKNEDLGQQLADLFKGRKDLWTFDAPLFDVHKLSPGDFMETETLSGLEKGCFDEGELVSERYRVVAFLGRGGMGEVFGAVDELMGTGIALKRIRPDVAAKHKNLFERFQREVGLAVKVTNPHVCRIHGFFLIPPAEGRPSEAFLTMELLDGKTLAERIKDKDQAPLGGPEAESIALQLCDALQAIHDHGIIHRDIKTNNVMLVQQKGATRAVVMDFGLACAQSEGGSPLTAVGAVMGTPGYMAPELLRGEEATMASDIYALGVVLGELAPVRPNQPRQWDSVISGCLDNNPQKRFQSANDVAAALQSANDVATALKPWRFRPQKPVFAVEPAFAAKSAFLAKSAFAAALVAFALAALIVGWKFSKGDHPKQQTSASQEAVSLYNDGRTAISNAKSEKDLLSAEKYFEESFNKDPGFFKAEAGMADAYVALWRKTKDAKWLSLAYNAALDAHKRSNGHDVPEVCLALGTIYTIRGEYKDAVEELDRPWEKLLPRTKADEGFRRLGSAYARWGHTKEAIEAYQRAIQIDPHYWNDHYQLGNLWYQIGDNQKALQQYQKVVDLKPDYSYGYEGDGTVLLRLAKYEEAITEYNKALMMDKTAETYSNIGVAEFYTQRYDDAILMDKHAIEMAPKNGTNHENLGDAYREKRDGVSAAEEYTQAISLLSDELANDPGSTSAMGGIALSYAKRGNDGDIKQGIEQIREALKKYPDDVDLVYDEAIVFSIAGRKAEAVELVKKALRKGYSPRQVAAEPDFRTLTGLQEPVKGR